MSGERYRFLLRMPEELRRGLVEATQRSGRSINAEIVSRLEESLDADAAPRREPAEPLRDGGFRCDSDACAAGWRSPACSYSAGGRCRRWAVERWRRVRPQPAPPSRRRSSRPHSRRSSPRTPASCPGNPHAPGGRPRCRRRVRQARGAGRLGACGGDPAGARRLEEDQGAAPRGARAPGRRWGRRSAPGLDNPFRDRCVYNAGTKDFSGRIAHVAIDPNCRENGQLPPLDRECERRRLENEQRARRVEPKWQYVSNGFEHNNTASIELDPNDKQARDALGRHRRAQRLRHGVRGGRRDLQVEERRATRGSARSAATRSTTGRGLHRGQAGDSNTIFAASGRAVRGISNVCCGGADALIPGAPHFGLYRSTNGGESWELVNQGAPRSARRRPGHDLARTRRRARRAARAA